MIHRNPLGHAVLSPEALRAIMGDVSPKKVPSDLILDLSLQGVDASDKPYNGYHGKLWVPELLGENIGEHFDRMAEDLLKPWKDSIYDAAFGDRLRILPEIPYTELQPGWNRLDKTGKLTFPEGILEKWAVFDTETFVKGSNEAHPIIATAINSQAVYIWLHPSLIADVEYVPTLVSVGGVGKVLIAHNSGYDFPRVMESYSLSPEVKNAWLCTMSMHQLAAGIDSSKVSYWKKLNKQQTGAKPRWVKYGSPKSLVDAYNLHCGGQLDQGTKEIRECFVKFDHIDQFKPILPELIKYAVSDVYHTHHLFQKIFPKYIEQAPSPVVLASHIYLATACIPVNDDWYKWINRVETTVECLEREAQEILSEVSEKVLNIPLEDRQKDEFYHHLPDKFKAPESTKQRLCHYLFRLTWKGFPVQHVQGEGMCYVDASKAEYYKIPHANGDGSNVGNLFSWDYYKAAQDGTLVSLESQEKLLRLMEIQYLTSYWVGSGSRIKEKMTMPGFGGTRIMALNCVPHNTITNRTGENLWLTVAAHNGRKCASEIRGKVVAPEGYSIVSFDVDSEELNLMSAYGASTFGISGSTVFDFSNLVGEKKSGTDVHSLVATKAGAGRDAAKSSVYGICYGAGFQTVANNFMKYHPELDLKKIREVSKNTLHEFKGTKQSDGYFHGGIASATFNKMLDILKQPEPATPILGTKLQPSCRPDISGQSGAPFQINWTVQSAGSSFLQCQIVAQAWLINYFGIDARLLMPVHDEFINMARSDQAFLMAYICQLAHCWNWANVHFKLGIYDLPLTRAFASSISIDFTWRKSPSETYESPTSEPIAPGKEYTMSEICSNLDLKTRAIQL